MGFYNHFTMDSDGNPVFTEIETDNPELAGTSVFDLPKDMTDEEWRTYWATVRDMAAVKLSIMFDEMPPEEREQMAESFERIEDTPQIPEETETEG